MPETKVIFYQDRDGVVPVLEWLKILMKHDRKGYANCVARIQQLASTGYELRRPVADYVTEFMNYGPSISELSIAFCTSFLGRM